MNAEPIKSERDHQRALKEIEGLMAAKPNTPEGDRLGLRVERFELRGPLAVALGVYCAAGGHQIAASAMSLGSRTRLWAAAVSVNNQPTMRLPSAGALRQRCAESR